MPNLTRCQRLTRMLKPKSIVFVGGGALEPAIEYTRRFDYPGELYVINPRRDSLAGITCARSAQDLPQIPELAFVAVPGVAAIDAVNDLANANIGACIVNTYIR